MPPKRALFSLNIDSNADHLYQRIDDHSKDKEGRTKVVEHHEPVSGHTSLQVLTKPFEKEVERQAQRVVSENISTKRESSSSSPSSSTRRPRTKKLEDEYDTSDL